MEIRRTAEASDASLREHLLYLLGGGGAHVGFDDAVKGLREELQGKAPRGLPYSPWQILEHIRIAQWDIVGFSRNREHRSPEWPGGYWPAGAEPPAGGAWQKSVDAFRADLDIMMGMVRDPSIDLHARIPWGEGQTILREALLVADHNAYHLGELIVVRRLLGAWR